jgi:hypothetical protein
VRQSNGLIENITTPEIAVTQTIMEAVLEFILECLISLFWWILLFPVVWLVSLPFILIIALFQRERYGVAVTNMLTSVHCFWFDWGIFFTP